ncbi:hypothetical protein NL108_005472 [Boleophthalmus pectinirostris]|uniref:interferon lambda receptor 1 n=1 Tax=Boleophthalmus pectinirostris TaxID=150288 RepID=UPI0024305C35|nr:interferon lambda receptor 1 [Boleophthalmus pectinirostris]KAJ0066269.1 hypothetical protein NL108_005472 [Boleophthalmus pectinirostris]
MTSRMVIFLLFCYACVTSSQCEKVSFTSKNFINILRWDAAEPKFPGETVRYSVLYSSAIDTDEEIFQMKAECQNITEQWCDLTQETPAVYDVDYRAKVMVGNSDYGQTRRFRPIAETVLGAPIVSHNINRTDLHVTVQLPLGPNNESITEIFRKNKVGPSEALAVYNLIITEPVMAAQELESTSGHFVVSLKGEQMKYCGYVVYKPAKEWGRPLSENTSFCVTRPAHSEGPWTILSVLSVNVLAAVALVTVFCVKRYVTDVKKIPPKSLVFKPQLSDSHKVIINPEEDNNVSKLEISTINEKTEYAKIQRTAPVSFVGDGEYGHSNKILSWPENAFDRAVGAHSPGLHYHCDSAGSSVIYGGVAFAENGECHQLQTDQAQENTSWISSKEGLVKSGSLLPSLQTITLSNVEFYENSEAQPLLLQTQRNSEGHLMLSVQGKAPFSETTDSTVCPQRKPLLSYLTVASDKVSNSLHSLDSSMCSDFGSDENTLPTPTQDYSNGPYLTQPHFTNFSPDSPSSLSCDSGTYDTPYKQNGMSSIISGTSNINYAWTWSGHKEKSKEAD